MKKLLYILAIVSPILFTGVSRLDGKTTTQSKRFITVEMTIGKEKVFHKYKVPIASKEGKLIAGKPESEGGCYSFTESYPKDIGSEYCAVLTADAVAEDSFRLTLSLSFKDRKGCNAESEFLVVRGKPTKFKMKCGAWVKAYYDSQPSATN